MYLLMCGYDATRAYVRLRSRYVVSKCLQANKVLIKLAVRNMSIVNAIIDFNRCLPIETWRHDETDRCTELVFCVIDTLLRYVCVALCQIIIIILARAK